MSLAFDLADFIWSEACPFPLRLRSYLAALAQRAHWSTGEGKTGRAKLARCTGISVRQQSLLRRELEALTDSPITVTWHARSLDGRRTSDRYVIAFNCRICGLNCKPGAHNCKPGGDQLQTLQRISITGSPTGDTHSYQKQEDESLRGSGLPAHPKEIERIERWAGPDEAQRALAAERGLDVARNAAAFAAYHAKHPEYAKAARFRGYAEAFTGWLKRQTPSEPKQPTAKELEAAEVAAWRASLDAGGT